MMKGFFLLVGLFSCLTVFAQPVIIFSQKSHDFGTIKEVNGSVSYQFEFVNNGNAPILIKNVESSCGCTSPEWSKQPVLPGKSGFVKAIFDPKERPGRFEKTITVSSNAKTPVVILQITGSVEPKNRTFLDDYPSELPSGIRLSLDEIALMSATKGENKSVEVGMYNNSGKNLNISFEKVPSHIKISAEPRELNAKQKGVVRASYNTAQSGEYGLSREYVTMVADGKKYQLPVSVFVEEDFSKLTPGERADAPKMEVEKNYFNFGEAASANIKMYTYRIKNSGKSAMKIYRFYTNDDRIEVELVKKELNAGESADVIVRTKRDARPGKISGVVSVITNSPDMQETKLRFYGEIK